MLVVVVVDASLPLLEQAVLAVVVLVGEMLLVLLVQRILEAVEAVLVVLGLL